MNDTATDTATTNDIPAAITRWIAHVQKVSDAYMTRAFPTLELYKYEVETNRKYARVWRRSSYGNDRSAHAFINLENGDILMAASWKKPAKHARGNVLQPADWDKWLTDVGSVAYLR